MKILLASTPVAGHFHPVHSLARMLSRTGHQVALTTGTTFKHKVETSGIAFHPLNEEVDAKTSDMDALLPERKFIPPGPELLRYDMERFFLANMPGQFRSLERLVQQMGPDVIVADALFFGTLPYLLGARSHRPPIVHLGIRPLALRRDDGAPFGPGVPPARTKDELKQYAVISRQVNAAIWEHVEDYANHILRSLGACELETSLLDATVLLPELFLQSSIASFEYPRSSKPASVHFIGNLPTQLDTEMPEGLEERLKAAAAVGKRVVAVTQGTVANSNMEQLLIPTIHGLAKENDLLVLAITGGKPVQHLSSGLREGNCIPCESLHLERVLPYVDVLVTNGGFGTITQALAHGVPCLVAGATEDKPEVAARVAWSGVGINLRTHAPVSDVVVEAVRTLINDRSYRKAALEMAQELSRIDTPREVNLLIQQATANYQPLDCCSEV